MHKILSHLKFQTCIKKMEIKARPRLDYRGKLILAPMVKIGTLPTRILALEYGADIVYTAHNSACDSFHFHPDPGSALKKGSGSRVVNDLLGTIDYIDKTDNSLVFRTCERERGHLVLQIGTSNGDRAAQVAKKMEQDIDGIDVNMGCPKSFSLKGGMGAALLSHPDKIVDILSKLKAAVSIPVTCKIRLLSTVEKTIDLVKIIEKTGIDAIGVHGRTKDQRPNHANNTDAIRIIAENTSLTVIANGGSSNNRNSAENTYKGIKDFWERSGASSVMIARAAEWNLSVFRAEEKDDIMVVIDKYLDLAIHYDYPFVMVKYCVQQMMGSLQDTPQGRDFLESSTMGDLCKVFGVEEKYRLKQKELGMGDRPDHVYAVRMKKEGESGTRKRKSGDDEITEMFCPFVRGHYGPDNSPNLPKSKLLVYTRQQDWENPSYKVFQEDKKFRSIVNVNGEFYSSISWEKNKRYAEQAAALVATICLGITEQNLAHQTIPVQTPSNQTIPVQTPSNQTIPDQSPLNQTIQDQTPSNQTIPDQTPSNQTIPDKILPITQIQTLSDLNSSNQCKEELCPENTLQHQDHS